MIALFSSHRQTGLKHPNLILFKLRLSLKSFWGAKVWNYLTEKSFDKSRAKAKEVICFYWAVEKKGQQQFNEPNLYRNFLLVTKWLFRARKVGPLWPQLIGGIDLIFPGTLPLNVTFKLPVSEISEIDDHKSVGFTISLHSFLHTFALDRILHLLHFLEFHKATGFSLMQ